VVVRWNVHTLIAVYLTIGLVDALYSWRLLGPSLSTPEFLTSSVALVFLWPVELATKRVPGLCAYWHGPCL
jgi:hypothetical protein